jgi:hypothetical protein
MENIMKIMEALKKWLCLAIILILTLPVPCFGSYRIELKSGRIIKTENYWEENDKIYFYYSGGIVSFKRDSIQKIEEYDGSGEAKLIPIVQTDPSDTDRKADMAVETDLPPDTSDSVKIEDKTLEDFHTIQIRFKDIDNLDKEALLKLAEDLTVWRNKIATDGIGHNYPDQLMDMDEMFDKIEAEIKERG